MKEEVICKISRHFRTLVDEDRDLQAPTYTIELDELSYEIIEALMGRMTSNPVSPPALRRRISTIWDCMKQWDSDPIIEVLSVSHFTKDGKAKYKRPLLSAHLKNSSVYPMPKVVPERQDDITGWFPAMSNKELIMKLRSLQDAIGAMEGELDDIRSSRDSIQDLIDEANDYIRDLITTTED